MDWTAAGVTVSGVLAVAAIVVQQVNRRTDRREGARDAADTRERAARDAAEARERAERAQETADEATAAAQQSAAATERMAKALEAQAKAAAQAAPTPTAAWELAHNSGDTYLLTNVGTGTAYDVAVDTGDMVVRDAKWPQDAIAPGDAAKFLAAKTMATKDDTVTVTWADEPGGSERRSYSRPLPPKPPQVIGVRRVR